MKNVKFNSIEISIFKEINELKMNENHGKRSKKFKMAANQQSIGWQRTSMNERIIVGKDRGFFHLPVLTSPMVPCLKRP